MEWITLALPLIRGAIEGIRELFRETNGRDPTDTELVALLNETDARKSAADSGWATSLAARRGE